MKTENRASEVIHCSFKTKSCSCARLVKEYGKTLSVADMTEPLWFFAYLVCYTKDPSKLFNGQVERIHQVSHFSYTSVDELSLVQRHSVRGY